ncbi:hypothetical protein EVG20_g5887 [Dentipellis fragilis]|uniref:Man(5)GlcNAc(2)-PP-dolichol translocation protein RFT1 n=1 Tax=Dentipellis fragilis TaxID=205917 RepID=A0A4Y9YQF9_9AGAM|nr:hypothetical protein EVG20_g5887 [Dentipellis fragilis]
MEHTDATVLVSTACEDHMDTGQCAISAGFGNGDSRRRPRSAKHLLDRRPRRCPARSIRHYAAQSEQGAHGRERQRGVSAILGRGRGIAVGRVGAKCEKRREAKSWAISNSRAVARSALSLAILPRGTSATSALAGTTMPSPDLLSASLNSASSLVLLQFFSRIFTFILNQALVRLASPQTFGTAAIQFELLLSTILFLSREGVRNALLRSPDAPASADLVYNISLLPAFGGMLFAAVVALIYIRTGSASTRAQPFFLLSVVIYAVAASTELLAEPLYIRAQNELHFDLRVRAEATAVFCKTFVTFVILAACPAKYALTAFAVGQLAYGQATLYTFATAYRGDLHYGFKDVAMNVHGNTTNVLFDPELLRLSGAMTLQSVVKHFLTEGDKFLVSRLSPLADQGGYAIASNYGSLVARILFQPIEETSRVFFSKTLPSVTDLTPFTTPTDSQTASLQLSSHILHTLLLLFTHLLLLLATFAPPFLPIATNTFLPPRYRTTSAPTILGAYIYYIPTMAYNGVLEAFLAAACTPADLRAQSRMMAGASLAFVVAAVWFSRGLRMGDAGLVWANIANLGARALYAWAFVRRYYAERGLAAAVDWRGAVPPARVLAVFVAAAVVTRLSARAGRHLPKTLWAQTRHVVTGGALAVGCLAACFVFEKDQFAQVLSVLRKRQSLRLPARSKLHIYQTPQAAPPRRHPSIYSHQRHDRSPLVHDVMSSGEFLYTLAALIIQLQYHPLNITMSAENRTIPQDQPMPVGIMAQNPITKPSDVAPPTRSDSVPQQAGTQPGDGSKVHDHDGESAPPAAAAADANVPQTKGPHQEGVPAAQVTGKVPWKEQVIAYAQVENAGNCSAQGMHLRRLTGLHILMVP